MDIDVPLRDLGVVDTTALCEAVLQQEDAAWHEDEFRQKSYHVHENTRSIVLLALDDSKWPERNVHKGQGWDRISDVAVPIMQEIIEQHYAAGGELIRAVAAKLLAGANIKAHTDLHESFHVAHRIHIPISTNSKVWFTIDGRPYQFETGRAYEINNQKQHSVMNRGDEDRITFIFDYIPPDPLANVPDGGNPSPAG